MIFQHPDPVGLFYFFFFDFHLIIPVDGSCPTKVSLRLTVEDSNFY